MSLSTFLSLSVCLSLPVSLLSLFFSLCVSLSISTTVRSHVSINQRLKSTSSIRSNIGTANQMCAQGIYRIGHHLSSVLAISLPIKGTVQEFYIGGSTEPPHLLQAVFIFLIPMTATTDFTVPHIDQIAPLLVDHYRPKSHV